MHNAHHEMVSDSAYWKRKRVKRLQRIVVKAWFLERPLFGGKYALQARLGDKNSICCSEFRAVHFSKVANVLRVWDF